MQWQTSKYVALATFRLHTPVFVCYSFCHPHPSVAEVSSYTEPTTSIAGNFTSDCISQCSSLCEPSTRHLAIHANNQTLRCNVEMIMMDACKSSKCCDITLQQSKHLTMTCLLIWHHWIQKSMMTRCAVLVLPNKFSSLGLALECQMQRSYQGRCHRSEKFTSPRCDNNTASVPIPDKWVQAVSDLVYDLLLKLLARHYKWL